MMLGELSQHGDYERLRRWVKEKVDMATEGVVGSSSGDTLDRVRYRSGYLAAYREMQMELDSARTEGSGDGNT